MRLYPMWKPPHCLKVRHFWVKTPLFFVNFIGFIRWVLKISSKYWCFIGRPPELKNKYNASIIGFCAVSCWGLVGVAFRPVIFETWKYNKWWLRIANFSEYWCRNGYPICTRDLIFDKYNTLSVGNMPPTLRGRPRFCKRSVRICHPLFSQFQQWLPGGSMLGPERGGVNVTQTLLKDCKCWVNVWMQRLLI
jgi:hypothetical protein